MRYRVHIDRSALRGWHKAFLERLAGRPDASVDVVLADRLSSQDDPVGLDLLLSIDALAWPFPRSALADRLEEAALASFVATDEDPDVVIDLTSDGIASPIARPALRLLYDGSTGVKALVEAFVAGRSPVATVQANDEVRVVARIGTDFHGSLRATLEDAFARSITILMSAIDGQRLGVRSIEDHGASVATPIRFATLRAAARSLGNAAATKSRCAIFHYAHWRVGWRMIQGDHETVDGHRPSKKAWQVLADDGGRFYADPFPLCHDGRVTLFVEEYDYEHRKGVIAAVEIGPNGPIGRPRIVLAEPYHLSYPFVFGRDGDVWMVPESSANRTIDLYRATRFPDEWVKVSTLVDDVLANDATLLEHDGRWWLFATVSDAEDATGGPRGSCSDTLHIWHAADFRGPWTAHSGNPVLVDAASARPAGRFFRDGGRLVRPVQDCRQRYGGALALARVDALDTHVFKQTIVAAFDPEGPWAGPCLHTFNRAGGLEVIDGASLYVRHHSLLNRLGRRLASVA